MKTYNDLQIQDTATEKIREFILKKDFEKAKKVFIRELDKGLDDGWIENSECISDLFDDCFSENQEG